MKPNNYLGLKLTIVGLLLLPFLILKSFSLYPIPCPDKHQPVASEAYKEEKSAPVSIKEDEQAKAQETANPKPERCIVCVFSPICTWVKGWVLDPIALFTYYILCVTALLAFYTYKLWESTKKLVEDSNIAEAPFILPDVVSGSGFFEDTAKRPLVYYALRNNGKSPAIVRRWRDYSLFTEKLPPVPDFKESWNNRPDAYIPIPPGEKDGLIFAQVPESVTRQQVLAGLDCKKWFYVIGEVEYEDIFGIIRIQGYCLRISQIFEDKKGIGITDTVLVMRDGGRAYNGRYTHEDYPY